MSSRLGIFGGAFNPIHHGHLIAAQEAGRELDIETILFIPTPDPPHKPTPATDVEDRLAMTDMALRGSSRMVVSRIELDLDGPSYTYRTLDALQNKYPDRKFYLLTGADELVEFEEWHQWEEIMDKCKVTGMSRPGFDMNAIPGDVREASILVDVPEIDISSTQIRERFSTNQPVRYFIPDAVWNYIQKRGLYDH